jgi:hypothetical protein
VRRPAPSPRIPVPRKIDARSLGNIAEVFSPVFFVVPRGFDFRIMLGSDPRISSRLAHAAGSCGSSRSQPSVASPESVERRRATTPEITLTG